MKKWNDWVSREEFPRLFAPSLDDMAEGEIAGWVTFSMKPLPSVIQMWSASNKDLMDSITLSPLLARSGRTNWAEGPLWAKSGHWLYIKNDILWLNLATAGFLPKGAVGKPAGSVLIITADHYIWHAVQLREAQDIVLSAAAGFILQNKDFTELANLLVKPAWRLNATDCRACFSKKLLQSCGVRMIPIRYCYQFQEELSGTSITIILSYFQESYEKPWIYCYKWF